ncbi:hypothetical protein INR49_031075 [Caranx melampygus]|nr:hypothetical protein INR49_031075 [Caranx melampygus]
MIPDQVAMSRCCLVLQDYAFFWDRSSGPKERGSSWSTVITSYVSSGFVRQGGSRSGSECCWP